MTRSTSQVFRSPRSILVVLEENTADPADTIRTTGFLAPVVAPGDVWQLGLIAFFVGMHRQAANLRVSWTASRPTWSLLTRHGILRTGYFSGLGRHRHHDFAMARGEKSEEEFIEFLSMFLRLAQEVVHAGRHHVRFHGLEAPFRVAHCRAGATAAAEANLAFGRSAMPAMGSFYRSQHELVAVFKNGDARHLNTFELGHHGRHRSNLWELRRRELAFTKAAPKSSGCTRPATRRARRRRDPGRAAAWRRCVLDPFAVMAPL